MTRRPKLWNTKHHLSWRRFPKLIRGEVLIEVDWDRLAKTLAEKAQYNKSLRTSLISGAIRLTIVKSEVA